VRTAGGTNKSVRAAALTMKTRRRDGGADAPAGDAGKDRLDRQRPDALAGQGDKADSQSVGDTGEGDTGEGEGATGGGKARKALAIAFTLRSSTYATMCIRELLKTHSEEAALGLRDV